MFILRTFATTREGRVDYDKQSIELVEVFLTCGFESMKTADMNNYQLRNSADSRLLWGCVQKQANWTPVTAVDCFIRARKTCLARPVKMVKTIRLRGAAARRLVEAHEDLRLLYLVRDPRGAISSQKRVFGNFRWENVGNFSAAYCRTFREDLAELGRAMDLYPGRLKVLRYESLAQSPMEVSEELFRFLGLNFTPSVREFVFNKTMAGQRSKNAYGTSRRNSTEAAYSWRRRVTLAAVRAIDENCRDVYEDMGYVSVNTREELMDYSFPLKKTVTFHGQLL